MKQPEHLIAELRRHGVTQYRIEHGSKHPRIVFQWQGREMFRVFPCTPGGDQYRAEQAQVAELRRMLGVKRAVAPRSGRAPRRRTPQPHQLPPAPNSFTVPPDPWAALRPLSERLHAGATT